VLINKCIDEVQVRPL